MQQCKDVKWKNADPTNLKAKFFDTWIEKAKKSSRIKKSLISIFFCPNKTSLMREGQGK